MAKTTIAALGAVTQLETELVNAAEARGIGIGWCRATALVLDNGFENLARNMLIDADIDAARIKDLDLTDDVRTSLLGLFADAEAACPAS